MDLKNQLLSSVQTVAFEGLEIVPVEVQMSIGAGLPSFIICGLADKAINESRERIRSALAALGLSLPARRIVVNMAPANKPKEGSHYDLPIALALLKALGVIPQSSLDQYLVLGELGLDSKLIPVPGVLVAAIHAARNGQQLICPEACGSEAACGGEIEIVAAPNLGALINYFRGTQSFPKPVPKSMPRESFGDMSEVHGNPTMRRALEIAAAGGHHMLMVGAPGVGKSMCAKRLGSILPDLSIEESLEVSMIYSIAGLINNGLVMQRQFREPHHNASTASILGGGRDSKPGEISFANRGVLFLDEITLWPASVLNGLRESIETGYICISRVNAHVKYPAKYQLIAAMNPCPCGKAYDPDVQCKKLPACAQNYMNKIPGPILDRFSMIIHVTKVNPWDNKNQEETSAEVKRRVMRAVQMRLARNQSAPNQELNSSDNLELTHEAESVLNKIAQSRNLSNRKYYNAQRISRTIADLAGQAQVQPNHVLEAITYLEM